MGMDPKNVLLASSAYWVIVGLVLALLPDRVLNIYGIDIAVVLSEEAAVRLSRTPYSVLFRERFIDEALLRFAGSSLVFMGMVPVFIMATAKKATINNICFIMGVVYAMVVVDYYISHHAYAVELNVRYLHIQPMIMIFLALACFSGAGFALPSCKLADVTAGPLEMYLVATGIHYAPYAYFFPGKFMQTYQVDADAEFIRHSVICVGMSNICSCWLVPFTLLASSDEAAKGKFAQLSLIFIAVNLGMAGMLLSSCSLFELESGPFLLECFLRLIGLFCASRAADKLLVK